MKTLETLIKRVRADIDALAVEAGRAEETRNAILSEQAAGAAATEAEAQAFDGTPFLAISMSAYLDKQKIRQAELAEALELAEKAHKECRDALSKAYAELKRLEFVLGQQKLRERLEAEQIEQNAFDERSSQMHARKLR